MKIQNEPTVGHLGSAKNVQDPSTGRTSPHCRKHSTTLQFTLLQGLPKTGALQLVYDYNDKVDVTTLHNVVTVTYTICLII